MKIPDLRRHRTSGPQARSFRRLEDVRGYRRLASLAGLWLAWALGSLRLAAWEGHDWNRWREVSEWRRPEGNPEQAGRREWVPLLDKRGGRVTEPPAWASERARIADTLRGILGEPSGDLRPPGVEVRELGVEALDGYVRKHLRIRTETDDWIPAYLLLPARRPDGRLPAMICLHQTVAQGKEEPCGIRGNPEMAFAVELVRRGYVCLAPDAIGFGERIAPGKQPYDDSLAFYRRHPRWSFLGKMIWDVSRLVDYLETLPEVDGSRIGSLGHSHGAYGTLWATAFEPRIAAAVASCGFTTFRSDPHPERWSHLTALLPQLGLYLPDVSSIPFDWQHVLALAAPRRLFVWYTTRDAIFPGTENLDALLRDVQGVYRLLGNGESLTWMSEAAPHVFPREKREVAYHWLDRALRHGSGADKAASTFFPPARMERARENAANEPWAAALRDSLVAAAKPWMEVPDDTLWGWMFGNTLKRAWQVWSDGHCPACRKPVPMYEWEPDALVHPWKLRCPRCGERFPKNDFARFHRSGLDASGVFDPARADRSLLFNAEHPEPSDPLHRFGVDDGDGYVADGKRWRFVNAYLVYGQWKQAIVGGIGKLAAAYVATGDPAYAHKAGILLDRAADLYPSMDFGREGVMYEGPPRSGYVSTWHDACMEIHDLAIAYDAVYDGLAQAPGLVPFLRAKAASHPPPMPKDSLDDVRRNIEERLFRDTLRNRPKIESNYPMTDKALLMIEAVLGWPANRGRVTGLLDAILEKSTAVDGLTGEKGIEVYSAIAPHDVAGLLGWFQETDPAFLAEAVRRHPSLHAMYRFHIDTWCLGLYYPRTGDTGSFAARVPRYAGVTFTQNPGIGPSSYAFLWALYQATGDADFVRVLHQANGGRVEGLPHDLFARDPSRIQREVGEVIRREGAELRLRSVNKPGWGLAVLRSGEGAGARAAWLDYDSGERHGHADAMTIGLFAEGVDLLPDFGYPPVQYGGWSSPRARWYTRTAAHNTVLVDGRETVPGTGKTTLWMEGDAVHAVRASGPALAGVSRYERTLGLVDVTPAHSYVLDVFRVAGGREHIRFLHGHFGTLLTEGLTAHAGQEGRWEGLMRHFREDPAPAPGWAATWELQDRLGYLPAGSRRYLRVTDFTRGAEVRLAESWVALGMFVGTDDAWVPSVHVRRRAATEPLASTFVGVLEPHTGSRVVERIRRLELRDALGGVCGDADVGLEVRLAAGGRDVILARDAEILAPGGGTRITEREHAIEFDGSLALVRWGSEDVPTRVAFGHGTMLKAGRLRLRARHAGACFEIALRGLDVAEVSGEAGALDSVEIDGVRRWPR